jgi:hypothetical protein
MYQRKKSIKNKRNNDQSAHTKPKQQKIQVIQQALI